MPVKGIYTFTASQNDTLYDIAVLCPISGGVRVYTARALYAFKNDTIAFDDSTSCEESGERLVAPQAIYSRHAIQTRIIPNPTSDYATLHYRIPI